MDAGPRSPTVSSVARTSRLESGCDEPSGIVMVAVVPWSNTSVAWRVPSASVTAVPRATWVGSADVGSMVVTCGS